VSCVQQFSAGFGHRCDNI